MGLALFDTTPESFATLLRMPILSRPFILSFTPAHTRPPAVAYCSRRPLTRSRRLLTSPRCLLTSPRRLLVHFHRPSRPLGPTRLTLLPVLGRSPFSTASLPVGCLLLVLPLVPSSCPPACSLDDSGSPSLP